MGTVVPRTCPELKYFLSDIYGMFNELIFFCLKTGAINHFQ